MKNLATALKESIINDPGFESSLKSVSTLKHNYEVVGKLETCLRILFEQENKNCKCALSELYPTLTATEVVSVIAAVEGIFLDKMREEYPFDYCSVMKMLPWHKMQKDLGEYINECRRTLSLLSDSPIVFMDEDAWCKLGYPDFKVSILDLDLERFALNIGFCESDVARLLIAEQMC